MVILLSNMHIDWQSMIVWFVTNNSIDLRSRPQDEATFVIIKMHY